MTHRDMPYLPVDIVIEILKRLPFKSLVSVSKCWKHLIDSPSQYFINENLHYTKHQNPSLVLWTHSGVRLIDYEMHRREVKYPPFFRLSSNIRVIGSCNGLICIGMNESGLHYFVLWNPSIGDVRRVPLTKSDEFNNGWPDCIAFGFDAIANDHKIVRVYYENHTTKVEVYSLQKGSWSEIKPGILENVDLLSANITCDGCIFWYGIIKHYEGRVKFDYFIVSFNLATEVFSLIPGPPSHGFNSSAVISLSTFEGKLALLAMGRRGFRPNHLYSVFHVWLVEGDLGSSMERWRWTKKYTSYVFPSTLTFPLTIWGDRFIFRSYRNTKSGFQDCTTIINTKDGKMLNIHGWAEKVFVYTESLLQVGNMHFKNIED